MFMAGAIAASVFSLSPMLSAQEVSEKTIENAKTLRAAALRDNSAYDILESLTTEVGPRPAGSEADKLAIKWGIEKFKSLGFDKVWTEPVKHTGWARVLESAVVKSPFVQPLQITALGGSVSTPEGGLDAEIVHFNSFEDLQAAERSEVEGKIVFISNRMARTRDGSGYGPANIARRSGADETARKGGLAVLIRSIGTDSHRLPHTGQMAYAGDVEKVPAAALSNPDADLLERIFKRGKPVKISLRVETKDLGPIETANVIGEITGREKPDEVVVIGGHLDSWDLGTGAIDDGAGVALTVATADLIKRTIKERPRRTIRVIMFGAEEVGLVGARQYAEAHKDEIPNTHIIGAESDFGAGKIWALASKVSTNSQHVIDKMAQLMGPLGVIRAEVEAGGGPDVGRIGDKGMPVVDLKQDGTDYFDLHHTADDTLDKVDPEALRQNLAAWSIFAYIAAEWPGDFR
ncbi:M28 family peptidase [Kordiimonas sp. SCSIO 12610]|nr:M28 family peptidase [Kordiimonas sp. SCSIO 12610]